MNKKIALNTVKDPLLIVDIKDIIYFEKDLKLIKVQLRNYKENAYLKMSMKNLQCILENENLYNLYFFRPHCSYIVNVIHINVLKSTQVIMSNKDSIPISYSNRKTFVQLISKKFCLIG